MAFLYNRIPPCPINFSYAPRILYGREAEKETLWYNELQLSTFYLCSSKRKISPPLLQKGITENDKKRPEFIKS